MSEHGLHPARALPRDVLAPFFVTAPVALVALGALLCDWGSLAISTHWSSLTLGLTHLWTLGFLSLNAVALVYSLLCVAADGAGPSLPLAHGLYYLMVSGSVALVYGTMRSSVGAVFFSVGAMGLMGAVWLVHAGLALRRARDRGTTFAALRLSLLGFFLVAFLGIWLGHGHGGMKFPGPRPLWLQVHLCVGLTGWVGAVVMAASWRVVPVIFGGRAVTSSMTRALHGAVALGIVSPVLWLLADYFGLLGAGDWDRAPGAALLTLPALVAVWGVHPFVALSSLRGRPEDPALALWRTALGLGPFTLLAAVAAFTLEDERFALLFGWLAFVGWAGFAMHALMVRVVPFLAEPARSTAQGTSPWTAARIPDAWTWSSLALHLTTLVVGGVAIVTRRDVLTRIAGLALMALGVVLLASYLRALRRPVVSDPGKSGGASR